jgi:DNA primase
VVVNYDGDRAGVQAAKRAIETILAEDIEVKVLVLPDNADPDEFIRKTGVSEYQRRRGEALPHIQFVIDQAVRDRNLHNPADKAAAVEETLPFVRAVHNRIQKREYFDIAMDSLRVQGDQRRELWQQVKGGASPDPVGIQRVITRRVRPTVAEEKLLGLLLASDELRNIMLPRLEPSDYEGLATAAIFRALAELGTAEKEITFDLLSEATADNSTAAEILPRIMMDEPAESFDESLADANSCLDALRLMKLDREIDELSSRIAEADRAGENELRDQLAMKKLGLSKQRGSFLPHGRAGN